MDATTLFERDGDRIIPTALSRGPWDERSCHGGPIAALLGRAVELADAGGVAWQVARLTVELTRPVPVLQPLQLEVRVERPGRKVSLVAAALSHEGTEVARVLGLRIRRENVAIPQATLALQNDSMPSVETGRTETSRWAADSPQVFHRDACEHRFVEGSWAEPGPVAVWIRLRVPLFAGEDPSGVQRVAAAADFGNGVSGALPYERFLYINPDLTIHLLRPPTGEWVGMRTASYYGAAGAGMAESALYDANGRLGRSVQSLFVAPR